ncbi:NDR1/HIN1-like protein 3 [Vicia villosa]|uniref:NDR1/HIN1-like protein 3 n=1 Tax=Vicia villosa TaxID=3911 RepID=UPI00273C366A|nr:NDR1/HIN1-like protein 3 [Vicia villosa]
MAINFQPSFESIRLIFLKLFAVSFSSFMFFLLVSIFLSSNVKFHITESSLSEFNLTSNNTLDYKLEANIAPRNSNKNAEIWHWKIVAIAWYEDIDFADEVNLSYVEGKGVIKLKSKAGYKYKEEARLWIYNQSFFDF